MKALLLTLFVAASAFGAAKPLVVKTSGGGFMMPEFAGGERCELYADKVVITHQYGAVQATALQLVEERKISLKGNVAAVIEKAKGETLNEKPNGLCDGPSTGIVANLAEGESVLLFTTGGCGSPRKERTGAFTSKLRSIIDLYCSKTYDFKG